MALNPLPTANTLKQRLDAAGPTDLADALRLLGFGTILRQQKIAMRRQNPHAAGHSPYAANTLDVIVLPDDAKASYLEVGDIATSNGAAWARTQDGSASTGSTGAYTYKTPAGTNPTTGTVGITASGDVAFLTTDAVNDCDFMYQPCKQDVVELTLPVVPGTGVCALPAKVAPAGPGAAGLKGVLMMMEAESLAGTLVSKMIVLVPAAGAPATGNARLDVAKANVQFAVADAVTQARVKLGVVSAADVNALLEAASPVL